MDNIKSTNLMGQILLVLFSLASISNVWAQPKQYQIQPGDSLGQILRSLNYGQNYRDLLPFINQVLQLNQQAFTDGNANALIPDAVITLPKNPNEPEPVPQPVIVPDPEPIPEPEPQPEPEPVEPAIGRITVSSGSSEIVRQTETIYVSAEEKVYLEDIIFTQEKTRAQINLLDDSSFTLGPNSHFVVNEFSFSEKTSADDKPVESLVATIHKGVLRIITGLIGKNKNNQYDIKSALTSTIGIRGTDFTVRSCIDKATCGDLFGVSAAVQDGGIGLKNQTSEITLIKNEFAQVQSALEPPRKAPLPEGFFDLDRDVREIKVIIPWWQKTIDWVSSIF
jgi:hypothetical protein